MADLQTLLSYFLQDLYVGTWGSTLSPASVKLTGATGGATTTIQSVSAVVNTTGGAATEVSAGLLPAGSLILGVTARVTTIIAGGGIASFSIGHAADTDAWGVGILVAAGTTTSMANFTVTSPMYCVTATDLRLTANAGTFTSGVVRLSVSYLSLVAPAS